jgi:hypothetical protein
MRFARWVFTIGAIYGVLILAPLYFMEGFIAGRDRGPMAYPEHYYGFVGAALSFQVMYLIIGRDPARFRPLMPLAVLAKLSFGVPCWLLFAQGRTPLSVAGPASVDLLLAALFVVAFFRTRPA